MKLSTKIGILICSVLTFTIIVEVFFILPQIRDREINLQETLYEERITPIAMEIAGFQDEMRYNLEMIARMPEIRGFSSAQQELILSISSRSSWRFETVDMGIADTNGNITCLKINDQSGIPLTPMLYTKNLTESGCVKECMEINMTCFSEPFQSGGNGPLIITMATPLYDLDEQLSGVVFAHASIESVLESIKKFELDVDESLIIVDSSGVVLAQSGMEDTISGLNIDYSMYEPVSESMLGNSGAIKYTKSGEEYIAGYTAVAPAGWGLVLEKPLSSVLDKSNVLPNFILATTLALFIFTAGITILGSRNILKPLDHLVYYADKVAHGEYDARLDVKGKDEVARLTTAIKSMVAQIVRAQEEEVSTLIGSLNEGVIVFDGNGRIIRANSALEEMLDIRASKVIGRTLSELEHEKGMEKLTKLNRAYMMGREAVFENPQQRIFAVRSSGIRRGNNQQAGEVRIVLDVTKQKELEQMQSDFIANTTHELRTPLHSIRGFINLLLSGHVEDKNTQHEFLTIVDNESQHLNSLVDSILNISRIESGNMKFNVGPVEMDKIVKDVIVKIQKIADEKCISVHSEINEPVPVINGDSEKLGQVIRNLLSNAIKFSHPNSKVTIRMTSDDNEVLVSVEDEGIGIATEHIPLLFQKFSQIDSSRTRSQNGTGLGLYITKHFVEAHGGTIWIESEQGMGSVFSFTLRGIECTSSVS